MAWSLDQALFWCALWRSIGGKFMAENIIIILSSLICVIGGIFGWWVDHGESPQQECRPEKTMDREEEA